MKQTIFVLLALLTLTTSGAASFDCGKARSEVEKTICADETLSKLDESMSTQYRQALQRADIRQQVINSQIAWLKNARNACQTSECLKSAYETRIKELGLTSSFGLVFITPPPGEKPPAATASSPAVANVAPLPPEAPKLASFPPVSPDEYSSLDTRCPDNLGGAQKYDIYAAEEATYVQDRASGFGVSDKAIKLLDSDSIMQLAKLCEGKVVAVWAAKLPRGYRAPLSARVYDNQFRPLTDEFQVAESSKEQSDHSVAPLKNGGFVVTWETNAEDSSNRFATNIYARIFGPKGTPTSGPINVFSDNNQRIRATAYGLPNGGFAVVWQEALYSIYLRYFDANGKPKSDAIKVLSSSDLATNYSRFTSYGYVARDGSLNLFIPNDRSVHTLPLFSSARSYSVDGVPQSEILKPDDLKGLPGYKLMEDQFIHNKALVVGMVLPGFNSHDKSGRPICKQRVFGSNEAWVDKLLKYSKDPDTINFLKQLNNTTLAACPRK